MSQPRTGVGTFPYTQALFRLHSTSIATSEAEPFKPPHGRLDLEQRGEIQTEESRLQQGLYGSFKSAADTESHQRVSLEIFAWASDCL